MKMECQKCVIIFLNYAFTAAFEVCGFCKVPVPVQHCCDRVTFQMIIIMVVTCCCYVRFLILPECLHAYLH